MCDIHMPISGRTMRPAFEVFKQSFCYTRMILTPCVLLCLATTYSCADAHYLSHFTQNQASSINGQSLVGGARPSVGGLAVAGGPAVGGTKPSVGGLPVGGPAVGGTKPSVGGLAVAGGPAVIGTKLFVGELPVGGPAVGGTKPFVGVPAVGGSTPFGRYSIPNDHYRCAEVCKCHNKTKSDPVGIYADCSGHSRHYSPNFPPTLPFRVSIVDISGINISHFRTDHFAPYKYLTKLVAQNCYIETVNRSPCKLLSKIRQLDLSNNGIKDLGNKSLTCMKNLRVLRLHNNKIEIITSHVFTGLSALKTLTLSKNEIHIIDAGAFEHCQLLSMLDLSFNKGLYITNNFTNIFNSLNGLKTLFLHGVGSYGSYPTKALLELPSLAELSVNGEKHDRFNPEQVLKRLKTLAIKGFCWTKNLTSSYFEGLPLLEYLNIEQCQLHSVSLDVFDKNKFIRHVEFYFSFYSIKHALNFTCNLRNQTLQSLSLIGQRHYSDFKPHVTLNGSDIGCLNELHDLQTLNLDHNNIGYVSMDFIRGLPRSLKELSIKFNRLAADSSISYQLAYAKDSLPNLKSLYEDYQGSNVLADKKSDMQDLGSDETHERFINTHESVEDLRINHANELDYKPETGPLIGNDNIELETKRPDTQVVNYSAAYSFKFGAPLLLRKFSGNHFVNLSNIFLCDWGIVPLTHLPRHVAVADLSGNRCDVFKPHFFQHNNSLLELHLQGNYFGPQLSRVDQQEHFQTLIQLQYLDLSKNYLFYLPWEVFQHQKSLKFLRLSSNNLVELDIQLSHMNSLVYLDLKENSLMGISERTRKDLDQLAERSGQVTIDLGNNPLMCTCQGLNFLRWLRDTRVRILDKDFLSCNTKNMKKEALGDLETRITSLERECVSKKILVMSCSFAGVVFIIICTAIWVFINRWKIIFYKNLVISHLSGFHPNVGDSSSSFTFDAFVVYTSTSANFVLDDVLQELETKRGHRLCVEDRDFIPGTFIPCNITSAVRNSRTTVVVVNSSFKPEGWTHYAVEMAQVEEVRAKRDVLHLLFLDSLPEECLPNVYLKAAKDGRVSEMPPTTCSPDVMEVFWDSLSRTIGHCSPNSNNRRPHLPIDD